MNFDQLGTFALDTMSTVSATGKPRFISRLTSHSAGVIVQNAMLEATVDCCQAQLAKTVLEHTGALSAMEAQLSAVTPQATGRYRAIVDVYAMKAIQRIAKGGNHGK